MNATPELSYPVEIADLPQTGVRVRIEANTQERAALAARFGLISLDFLEAEAVLKPWRKRGIAVSGRFTADVTQACVVSLDPVAARVGEDFKTYFLPQDDIQQGSGVEITVDVDGAPDPDPLDGDRVDVGELVAEHVSLALDPYPRKPGAEFSPVVDDAGEDGETPVNRPFEALAKLRRKDD